MQAYYVKSLFKNIQNDTSFIVVRLKWTEIMHIKCTSLMLKYVKQNNNTLMYIKINSFSPLVNNKSMGLYGFSIKCCSKIETGVNVFLFIFHHRLFITQLMKRVIDRMIILIYVFDSCQGKTWINKIFQVILFHSELQCLKVSRKSSKKMKLKSRLVFCIN